MNKLIGIADAAYMLGVNPMTLRRWEKLGKIQSIRIGKRRDRRYELAVLQKFIERNKSQ